MAPGRKSIAKQRRAEICDAFLRCARREGLYRASNRKIAREAGISLSMLHHYFKSREEMIEEFVQTKMVQEFSADLRAVVRCFPDDMPRLKAAIVAAMAIKPKGHEFNLAAAPVILRHMNVTGG